jgi:hypothetical protein
MLTYVTLEIPSPYINVKHLTNFDGNFIKISAQELLLLRYYRDGGGVVIVWYLGLQLPVQSVPITTKVVSSNPDRTRCTRYNIM